MLGGVVLLIPSVSEFFLVKERLLQNQHRDEHRNRQTKQGLTPEQARGLFIGFADPQLNKVRCFCFLDFLPYPDRYEN